MIPKYSIYSNPTKHLIKDIVYILVVVLFFLSVAAFIVSLVGICVMKVKMGHMFYVEGLQITEQMWHIRWIWNYMFLGSLVTGGITGYIWSEKL